MAVTNPGGPLNAPLLGTFNADGTITGVASGTSQSIDAQGYANLTVYAYASAAISAGTLIVEEAYKHPSTQALPTGTYSQVTSVTLSSPFSAAGGWVAIHLGGPGGQYAYDYVRVRIGTAVEGGTLAAALVGC